jgi:hypothetical protein
MKSKIKFDSPPELATGQLGIGVAHQRKGLQGSLYLQGGPLIACSFSLGFDHEAQHC